MAGVVSASAVRDGLVSVLSGSAYFGQNTVDTDYKILETSNACCIVVSWAGYEGNPISMGAGQGGVHIFLLELRLKEVDSPTLIMDRTVGAVDKMLDALKSDDTLNGTAKGVESLEGSREPGVAFVSPGGNTWLPVDFTARVQVWDG
jgi:hypothetical protein